MNKIFVLVSISILFLGSTVLIPNNISNSDVKWESLFDGKTLNGWHRFNRKGVKSIWTAKKGVLTFDPDLISQGDYVHDLVTDKIFKNFQLSIEWNISEGGNSGVFWGVQEGENLNKPYSTGPEIQILDSKLHPDAKANPKFHQAGALYDLVQPSKDVCKPAGKWNHFLLTINHNINKGNVELNGTMILEFPLRGEKWEKLVSKSKFNDKCEFDRFARIRSGKIGLQDHGNKVSFRNIKIRKL